MSTISSEIQVAKLACDLLKETPLSSWDDDTPVGRWMKRNFKIGRNTVLSQSPWGFAIRREILNADGNKPAFNWSTQYVIPPDVLRVLPLRYGGTLNGRLIDWEREGQLILTNFTGPLKARFIFEQEDASTWSPLFVTALSTLLGLWLSQWLTGKNTFTQIMQQMHSDAMTAAVFANGAEGIAASTTGTYYDDVRYGSDYIDYRR